MRNLDPMSNAEDIIKQREVEEAAVQLQQEAPIAPVRTAAPLPLDAEETESNLRTTPLASHVQVPDSVYRRLELNSNDHRIDDHKPYHYRLPLGSYILGFLYMQGFLLGAGLAIISALNNTGFSGANKFDFTDLIMPIICLLLVVFLLSGNNLLRIAAIVLSFATVTYLVYGFVKVVTALSLVGFSPGIALMVVTTTTGVVAAPAIILLITGFYLMKSKVSDAYQ